MLSKTEASEIAVNAVLKAYEKGDKGYNRGFHHEWHDTTVWDIRDLIVDAIREAFK